MAQYQTTEARAEWLAALLDRAAEHIDHMYRQGRFPLAWEDGDAVGALYFAVRTTWPAMPTAENEAAAWLAQWERANDERQVLIYDLLPSWLETDDVNSWASERDPQAASDAFRTFAMGLRSGMLDLEV